MMLLKVYEPTPFYTSIFDRKSFHFPHLVIDEIIEKEHSYSLSNFSYYKQKNYHKIIQSKYTVKLCNSTPKIFCS